MEKRLILAMALSLLLLLAWSAMMPKQQPIANKEVINKDTGQVHENVPEAPPSSFDSPGMKDGKTIDYRQENSQLPL